MASSNLSESPSEASKETEGGDHRDTAHDPPGKFLHVIPGFTTPDCHIHRLVFADAFVGKIADYLPRAQKCLSPVVASALKLTEPWR